MSANLVTAFTSSLKESFGKPRIIKMEIKIGVVLQVTAKETKGRHLNKKHPRLALHELERI